MTRTHNFAFTASGQTWRIGTTCTDRRSLASIAGTAQAAVEAAAGCAVRLVGMSGAAIPAPRPSAVVIPFPGAVRDASARFGAALNAAYPV
jgi:hypothetical protein